MSQIESLRILSEIDTLVSIKLQVVSYKWLSREFSVPSNDAKKLLEEFVQKHGARLQVIYSLSGWLKSDPQGYHIRLVSTPFLSDARKQFDGNCSVQVYSVQLSIPKDPAEIWNTEFIQAEELFKQPPAVENCLRDCRFGSIFNALVKRHLDGAPSGNTATQSKTPVLGSPRHANAVKTSSALPAKKAGQSRSERSGVPLNVKKEVKSENEGVFTKASKPSSGREKTPSLRAEGTAQIDVKPRGMTDLKENFHDTVHGCGNSDDDSEDVNFKKVSNGGRYRRRMVVLDFSDDEDDYVNAVNLSSPEPPAKKSRLPAIVGVEHPTSMGKEDFEKSFKDAKLVESKRRDNDFSQPAKKASSDSGGKKTNHASELNDEIKEDKIAVASSSSPKRRRVLKTTIDGRGREVTEVVWEGEETERRNESSSMTSKIDNSSLNSSNDRPPTGKKSAPAPAPAPAIRGKSGNKKTGGPKDPKQGNILAFFKKG